MPEAFEGACILLSLSSSVAAVPRAAFTGFAHEDHATRSVSSVEATAALAARITTPLGGLGNSRMYAERPGTKAVVDELPLPRPMSVGAKTGPPIAVLGRCRLFTTDVSVPARTLSGMKSPPVAPLWKLVGARTRSEGTDRDVAKCCERGQLPWWYVSKYVAWNIINMFWKRLTVRGMASASGSSGSGLGGNWTGTAGSST